MVLERKFILTHNYNCYNSYVLRISLHQTHILLNNGTEDLTIPFTNELQESWILLLIKTIYKFS